MNSTTKILYALILLVLVSSIPLVIAKAQNGYWNNSRDYEPIIIEGIDLLDFLRVPLKELYVYAYHDEQDSWQPIPFQFDQRDDSSHFWVPNPNNILDENDDLVFMAGDMGDQAPDGSYWIDDLDSRNYPRMQITVTDPVTEKQARVYIYRSKNDLPLSSESYMNYKPDSEGAGADTIIAKTYIQADTKGGIPAVWRFLDGSGVDILDRQKVRISMLLFGWVDFTANEAILENFIQKVEKKVGPVRVVREVFWHIDIGLGVEPFDFSLPLMYYPFNIESGGVSGNLEASNHVYLIRQSFDLNPDAAGMTFYNPYNQNGILIDGKGGDNGIVNTLADAPTVNWWLITGDQGTYTIIFKMNAIGETRTLYFHDDDKVLPEGEDTGDMMSWGDTGVKIEGTDIEGNISFAYKAYYLGANKLYSLGETLANNFENAMNISFQSIIYVPVELAFFSATDSDGKVILEWMTVTEANNYGFEIQRKNQVDDEWEKIGFIHGNGTTATPNKYSFSDHAVSIGTYSYRLKQIDYDGSFVLTDIVTVEVAPPKIFSLYQNYPNPFNPETEIRYQIPNLTQTVVIVELKIYNLIGEPVRTLIKKDQGAGYYSVRWDGKNDQGENVAAGTYIYQLRAGEFIKNQKMLLLR